MMKKKKKKKPRSLTPAQQSLAAANLGLVGHAIKMLPQALRRRATDEDLYAEGCVGLCNAARLYDPARAKFSTYATWAAYRTMLQYLRRRRGGATPALPTVRLSDEVAAVAGREDRGPDLVDARDVYRHAVRKLSGKRKALAALFFRDGLGPTAVGACYGVSTSRASQWREGLVESLRERMGGDGRETVA